MRGKSKWAAAGAFLLLAGACDRRPIAGSPDQDPSIVEVTVGPRQMRVPRGNFREADETLAILMGAAPDFAPRSTETDAAFRAPGSDPVVWVRVHRVSGVSVEDALARLRENDVRGELISAGVDGLDRHSVMRAELASPYGSVVGDVYDSPDGSFTTCSRSEGPIVSPSCTTIISMPPNIVAIRFGRKWLSERHAVRRIVEERIVHWTVYPRAAPSP